MIIEEIVMNNFRVFKGEHCIDLAPRESSGRKRPIILFGGLNGAGKTSTLMAIRLALYGRQSLGLATTKKDYYDFLRESIHKSKKVIEQSKTASVALMFEYASMGHIKHYCIKRSWIVSGNKVTESLCLFEDDIELSELNNEQCQGLLNELIPIGVSELFFFDGEKIAELAEDSSGDSLGDSIKKLLGLDLIDTLNADLSVLLRNKAKQGVSQETKKKIELLEQELNKSELRAEQDLINYGEIKKVLSSYQNELNVLENKLSARGGAWAKTRDQEIIRQAELSAEKKQVELQLKELISSSFPLSLAGAYIKKTMAQIKNEEAKTRLKNSRDYIHDHIKSLNHSLAQLMDKKTYHKVLKTIKQEFSKDNSELDSIEIIHDISESVLARIQLCLRDAVEVQKQQVIQYSKKLQQLNDKIDLSGKNISRAPDKTLVSDVLEAIGDKQNEILDLKVKQKLYLSNHKRLLRGQMDIVRQLDKLTKTLKSSKEDERMIRYAVDSKKVLTDFSKESARLKINDLESEFIKSFSRLSRKEDLDIKAKINPDTFMVKLLRNNGQVLHKDELSAGEKQIYAIAILEALAKTSGRHLPIIIDTPLGRLDSEHRTKLINNYFPYASHQVIILSTDTEIDESFYQDLKADISHAYQLEYQPEQGTTVANEGYFWKANILEAVS